MNDCMIPRAADNARKLIEAINRGEEYDYANGGPVSPPKPRIVDATWTDDYGREYHLVGRERLTAAEDEIARLTINLAETERERQKAVEREAKTAEALTVARDDLDAAKAEINRLSPSPKSTQSGAEPAVTPLPTPDDTNPSHLRWAAGVVEDVSDMGWSLDISGDDVGFTLRAEADRLEAAQQQADAAEVLVEKAARVIAVDSPPDALDYDTAHNLYAAGLLRGGDEQ